MTSGEAPKRIELGDIESKLREIKREIDGPIDRAVNVGRYVAIGVAVAGVVIAYSLGRRRGRKSRTFVEIRRI
jgi:hypothetical protein